MSEEAKKAFEAYCRATGGKLADKVLPSWDHLSEGGKAAWQAAVDAARDHAGTDADLQTAAAHATVAASADPNVRNLNPTGTKGTATTQPTTPEPTETTRHQRTK